MGQKVANDIGRVLAAGLAAAAVVGLAAGALRYWLGLAVLIQGSVCGLVIARLAARFGAGGRGSAHPGFKKACGVAAAVFICFSLAQAVGFGLAQPWFDPFGWLGRVLDGRSAEYVFGVAATAGLHRGLAMGVGGGFWLVLWAIDGAMMFFFLLVMPWSTGGSAKTGGGR